MRIALISDVYKPVINGVVNHVSLLKRYFEQWGEQVWLFVPGSQDAPVDEPNVIRIPGIPIADTGYHLSFTVDQRSRELLKQMDVIHVHHPFVSGSIGLSFSMRYHIPLVFTNHTRYDLYVQQYLPRLPEAISETVLQTYFQMFSQRCAAIIAPSASIAQLMQKWGVQGKVRVIPNGIELEQFMEPKVRFQREDLGIPQNAVVGIFVGRMSGEKSVGRLIRVFAVLAREEPHSHLLLVGGGPKLEEYRTLAQELGVQERITFTGSVPYEETPGYYHLADFFVSASVTEVHPLTFIEAAASGLPSVGIASPGVVDMIQDGETGFIAQDHDLSFGLGILKLLRIRELRCLMGRRAQEFSRQFSAHHNARQVLRVYQEVAGE